MTKLSQEQLNSWSECRQAFNLYLMGMQGLALINELKCEHVDFMLEYTDVIREVNDGTNYDLLHDQLCKRLLEFNNIMERHLER